MPVKSVMRIHIRAPYERIFPLAAEIERWPERLPHYRYVRRLPASNGERRFAMGARRGPIPVRWEADPASAARPAAHRVHAHRRRDARHAGRLALRAARRRLGREHPSRAGPALAAGRWLRGGARHRSAVHRRDRGRTLRRVKALAEAPVMKARRVAVTGIGAVTPIGHGADGLWAGVLANRSAVRLIDRFDASPFPSHLAAQIDDFRAEDYLDAKRARRLDRFSQFSVAAARMAVEQAGWTDASRDRRPNRRSGSARRSAAWPSARSSTPTTCGAACGPWRPPWPPPSSVGRAHPTCRLTLGSAGRRSATRTRAPPARWPSGRPSMRSGPGIVDAALAGGAEAPLAPLTFGAFAMIRVLSSRNDDPATASRPFDVDRDGFVMGEGVGRPGAGGPRRGGGSRRDDPGRSGRLRRLDRRVPPDRARCPQARPRRRRSPPPWPMPRWRRRRSATSTRMPPPRS